jgi:hypothetical protein
MVSKKAANGGPLRSGVPRREQEYVHPLVHRRLTGIVPERDTPRANYGRLKRRSDDRLYQHWRDARLDEAPET